MTRHPFNPFQVDPSLGGATDSLVVPPSPLGISPNVGHTIVVSTNFNLAAGGVRYAKNIQDQILGSFSGNCLLYCTDYQVVINNAGTVWLQRTTADNVTTILSAARVVNSGLIVSEIQAQGFGNATAIDLQRIDSSFSSPSLNNSGSIFALNDGLWAYGVRSSVDVYIVNSGTIAARSNEIAAGIHIDYGYIANNVGGLIEAEAHHAYGVWLQSVYGQPVPAVDNAGTIQAASTDPNTHAVGIFIQANDNAQNWIVNRGLIQADHAIEEDSWYLNYIHHSDDLIQNEQGGQIVGDVLLDLGDDTLINKGSIVGKVVMGYGDDTVDTSLGSISGKIDLGYDNDTFNGSPGDDTVVGGRGNDVLSGGAGLDVLGGGYGDDKLTGGAGSDALYGEYGDDVLVGGGGDFLLAGSGSDRIELADFVQFAELEGGAGFDTLVLPGALRTLDLAGALGDGVLSGIDALELGSNLGLVLRPEDVDALTDADKLIVHGGAGNHVYLVSGWGELGQVTFEGTLYRDFKSAAGAEVLVDAAVATSIQAAPPAGSAGFDLFGGDHHRVADPGDLSVDVTLVSDFLLIEPFTVFSNETWQSPYGASVFTTLQELDVVLTNYGSILSQPSNGNSASCLFATAFGGLDNYGTISAVSPIASASGVYIQQFGHFYNAGLIEAVGYSQATGITTADANFSHLAAPFTNDGTIIARTTNDAFPAPNVVAIEVMNPSPVINNGTIEAIGVGAVAVWLSSVLDLINTGTIIATATSSLYDSFAIRNCIRVTNSGTITGDVAIDAPESFITNTGTINGAIHLAIGPLTWLNGPNTLTNHGIINGSIVFGDFADVYDNATGHQTGGVVAGRGDDTLLGGVDDETFAPGAGNDIVSGGAGRDTVSYFDSIDPVTVDLTIATPQYIGEDAGTDKLSGIENAAGSDHADTLKGSSIGNRLDGGLGDDLLIGREGSDILTGAGGSDTFVFQSLADLTATGDRITDLSSLDKIDFSAMGSLTFIGAASFSHNAGEMHYVWSGDRTVVEIDANGDGAADQTVLLDGGNFDLLETAPGSRILYLPPITGGLGNDLLIGSVRDDLIQGREGDDILIGGAGDDLLDGGPGRDTASYQGANKGIAVDLAVAGLQSIGANQGSDTLVSIENVSGSSFDDVLKGNGGDNVLTGGAGSNYFDGRDGNDTFDISAGEDDTVRGGNGDDVVLAGDAFDQADDVDGGGGTDTLVLSGDYAGGLKINLHMMDFIDIVRLAAGFSYKFIFNDMISIPLLTIDGSALGSGDRLLVDMPPVFFEQFNILGGAGDDKIVLSGGAQNATLGDGNDSLSMGSSLDASDHLDGGPGFDTLFLNGDYSAGLTLQPATITGFDRIVLATAFSYKIAMSDANVAAGTSLAIDGSALAADNSLVLDGSQETDGSLQLIGGAGDDGLTGGAQADTFDLSYGGKDKATGGDGNDVFLMRTTFDGKDIIDGGVGTDAVVLEGDYGGPVSLGPAALKSIETIVLKGTHAIALLPSDSLLGLGQTLTIDGSLLTTAGKLTFRGGSESDGLFKITGGAGDDTLVGGARNDVIDGGGGNDTIDLSAGGVDIATGGTGNDTFRMGAAFTASDRLDGSAGSKNVLDLDGDYAGVTLAATTLASINIIKLHTGHRYTITSNDASVSAGARLTIDAASLAAADRLVFNGGSESDGNFVMIGGAGDDTLSGGAGADKLTGHLGADHLTGGAGADILIYKSTADSTGPGYDTVTGFDFASDSFEVKHRVKAIDASLTAGNLSAASFDSDLGAAINAAQLGKYHAVLFTANAGNLSGQTFLIIDANGVAGYQAGLDLVIHLDSAVNAGSIAASTFI
jgi:Ca2+-binding RTX toxin-like protein